MTKLTMKGLKQSYGKIPQLILLCILSISFLIGCNTKTKVDLLVKNTTVYKVDSQMTKASVMVIDQGKLLAVGGDELLQQYEAKEVKEFPGAYVYPGLIDAHSHFYGLGAYKQKVDLNGTKSWDEVITRCKQFVAQYKPAVLTGRGWDQNDWQVKEYPDNTLLNELFPDIPVLLKRVDGHAAIANDKALQMASITLNSQIIGGEIIKNNKRLTGVLIDNAVDLVQEKLPKPDRASIVQSLLMAQEECFSHGLTSVCDAGLDTDIIQIIDSLQQAGILKIRIYAMVSISPDAVSYWTKRGPLQNDYLNVSSFKMYADGALGSRGACMIAPYADQPGHHGLLLTPIGQMETYVKQLASTSFQLNTHCIGDSANRLLLQLYGTYLGENNKRRWRIEHAQVVHPNDFGLFGKYHIVPSVQPTHATSDMYWAEQRIGKERIKGAYALKQLLKQNGWIPLGTDFPVESSNPYYTFYAAVYRRDASAYPENGFQPEDALTREEALRGMTIWAAQAAFEENHKGSLEAGKLADFVVLPLDLMSADFKAIRETKPQAVFVGGKQVK